MAMDFECPKCGETVKRLVYGDGFGCDACIERRDSVARGILHQNAGNKYKPAMTTAEKLNITTRERYPDGRNYPSWRWKSNIGY